MTKVDQLNRRLGEMLGTVRGGMLPRFAWQWAPAMPYWSHKLGKVWVLCEYRPTNITVQEWTAVVGSPKGWRGEPMYCPYIESALNVANGLEPTLELTQFYISTISAQMDMKYEDILRKSEEHHANRKNNDRIEWIERTQNDVPAFDNWDSGSRAGHVSFGGI